MLKVVLLGLLASCIIIALVLIVTVFRRLLEADGSLTQTRRNQIRRYNGVSMIVTVFLLALCLIFIIFLATL